MNKKNIYNSKIPSIKKDTHSTMINKVGTVTEITVDGKSFNVTDPLVIQQIQSSINDIQQKYNSVVHSYKTQEKQVSFLNKEIQQLRSELTKLKDKVNENINNPFS